jgi:hypothetical protein
MTAGYVEICGTCGELLPNHATDCNDLGELLGDIERHVNRFVALGSRHRSVAIALWLAHVYAIDAAPSAAYLRIKSAAEESGKTTLLEVLEQILGHRGINTVSISPSVVFRLRDKIGPVALLLDEVDNTLRKRQDDGARDLLALVNAGYRRSATVYRSDGKTFEPRAFKTFGPAAVAGIGTLEATTESRCIPITLTRKPRGSLERFIGHLIEPAAQKLGARLDAWASSEKMTDRLRAAKPQYPEELRDRQVEAWWPLFAIADEAGEDWPQAARDAARALHGADEAVLSAGVLLLAHIRTAFDEADGDRLPTADLIELLVANEEGPWGKWWGAETKGTGPPRAAATDLARHLKGFGVKPHVIRLTDARTPRGYLREDFEDAWTVYLPPRNTRNTRNVPASSVASVASVAPPTPNGDGPSNPTEAMIARVKRESAS